MRRFDGKLLKIGQIEHSQISFTQLNAALQQFRRSRNYLTGVKL